MMKPNFLVIGAAKCGTTSIYHYLSAHPQVFVPSIKEPRYFALYDNPDAERLSENSGPWSGSVWRIEEYEKLFADATSFPAVGECSPIYLWSRSACTGIQ